MRRLNYVLSAVVMSAMMPVLWSLLPVPVQAASIASTLTEGGPGLPRATTALRPAPMDYTFALTNETSVAMVEFYASPQTATDWEDNVLGQRGIQANGGSMTITLAANRGCLYDFLAVFADGDKLERYGIDVCELETHTYYEN